MLLDLAKAAFKRSNWPTKVQTGALAFDLGINGDTSDKKVVISGTM
jgi:hypothetical protein